MNKQLLLFLVLGISTILSAQEKSDVGFKFCGYSGGMMLNAGYHCSNTFPLYDFNGYIIEEQQIKGMSYGIGGAIRFHFGNKYNQIRLGMEGYSTTQNYNYDSYEKIGWGGFLVDYSFLVNKFLSPFVGATLGGGSVKNHTYLETVVDDYIAEEFSLFRKYTFSCITPFIGIEIAVSKKMLLVCKFDYLINISDLQDDFAKGIRFYFGMVFNHTY